MEKKKTTWEVTIKEAMMDQPIVTRHTGYFTYSEVEEFFGCKQPDVEWYKIEEI